MSVEDEDPFIKHAALILRQEVGFTVRDARMTAWYEGPDGYVLRLEREMQKELDEDAE